jgi:hypothetical protein
VAKFAASPTAVLAISWPSAAPCLQLTGVEVDGHTVSPVTIGDPR